ncbi:F-box protein of unknown function [Desmophyllum pertusum]|uniref:F-box domain-containing protein n=1 Tax=Desmophyllum pertusum TaxID=174260 RepID=A0A9X0D4J1_9CNID|nr:F-box protein of unknown function [Desmophyllum pertusum]
MAAVRTKDRKRKTAKIRRDSELQRNKDAVESETSKIAWSFGSSKRNSSYKDLGVAELQWPPEDERELSQEIVRVKPLNRHSILQAPSHKFVVSHWGRTSALVASGLSSTFSKTWRSAPSGEGCTDCTHNRLENTVINKSDKPTQNYWMSLSDEIILAIFQFLTKKTLVKCAQICKHWQRLACDESLWRRVDMSKANLLPGILGKVIKRGTRVLRLAQAKVESPICDDNALFFPDVVPLSPKSPSESLFSLRYLDATSCSFQNDTLLCLLLHSRQLTHISLESCSVSTSVLKAISELRNLEVLNLAMCTGVTITGMCSLTQAVKCGLDKPYQGNNFTGIKQLVKSCPHLTHLDVSDGVLLSARSLEEILKLENLVQLGLSRCYNIPPTAFSSLKQMKSLKTLQIFGLLNTEGIDLLREETPSITINKFFFTSIARPVGSRFLGTIWRVQCKD